MPQKDLRYHQIKLDDHIVKATDEDGNEKLRLAQKVGGHNVLVQFPRYGDWDSYVQDLAHLMLLMSQSADNIQLPEGMEDADPDDFQVWASLTSSVIKYKELRSLVEKIFFGYLQPEVEDLEFPDFGEQDDHTITKDEWLKKKREEYTEEWLRNNMKMDTLFMMFTSILYIEDWLKKKANLHLSQTFPNLIQKQSNHSLQKSITSQQQNLTAGQPYEFD